MMKEAVKVLNKTQYSRLEMKSNHSEKCRNTHSDDYKTLIDLALDTKDYEWAKTLAVKMRVRQGRRI